jgi:hypothetical protein
MREDYEEPWLVLLIIEVLMNLSEPSGSSKHGGADYCLINEKW